ncbi:uncharacterized protein YgiM (DUF1202 family) [Lachnospiraceae bacterium PF1-21]|uniref:SH3 domain-containing protein n=1 Tax=Ohessyouella blattaphilus TaxID=2949333 RepID=UPI003E2F4684
MRKAKLLMVFALVLMVFATGCSKKEEAADKVPEELVVTQEETKEATKIEKEETIVGTLTHAAMNTMEIKTNEGTVLSFSIEDADLEFKNGIEEGHWVAVVYTGTITGTDTTGVRVIRVIDEGEHIDTAKSEMNINNVDEEVYATAGVHIRASYTADSEIVGSLAQGSGIRRTGVCDNGWSRVDFNGKDAYIYGEYLSQAAPAPTAAPAKVSGDQPSTPQTGDSGKSNPKPKPTSTPDAEQITIKAVVVDVQMGLLSVKIGDNDEPIIFDISDAKITSKNGIKDGNEVTIVYTGDLKDMDNVKVISVTDDDPNPSLAPRLTTGAGPQMEESSDVADDAATKDTDN